MDFETLQRRLLAFVRTYVRNGELTERGLARMIGISQPHMHHILKGARALSVENADRILRGLDLTVLDLIEGGAYARHHRGAGHPAAGRARHGLGEPPAPGVEAQTANYVSRPAPDPDLY